MNPWVAGWIGSDGHNAGNYWSISQNIEDSDPLYLIKNLYPDCIFDIRFNTNNRYGTKPMVVIKRKSKTDCDDLVHCGIPIEDKTHSVQFPSNYNEEDAWLYLRGFFEGDGSISIEKNRYPRIGITSSLIWCEGCLKFLNSQAIESYISKDGNVFCLNLHNIEGFRIFIKKLYEKDYGLRMGRKFSSAMKILFLLDYNAQIKRKKQDEKIQNRMNKKIGTVLQSGMSLEKTADLFNTSLYKTISIKNRIIGTRKEISRKKIEKIKDILKTGLVREAVIKKGYGRKLVNKAFIELFGDPSKIKEEKINKIREMLLKGYKINYVTRELKCGEAIVVKERRHLHSSGYPIKVNKKRGTVLGTVPL